jgi:hypothetical protein
MTLCAVRNDMIQNEVIVACRAGSIGIEGVKKDSRLPRPQLRGSPRRGLTVCGQSAIDDPRPPVDSIPER